MRMNEDNIIVRKECVLCGSTNLEKLYEFKDFPVNQNTTYSSRENDILLDLEYDICKESGMVQVKKLVPEDILYNGEHSRSIGSIWQNHHKAFAKFIAIFHPNSIFEIGGGAGYLEKNYNEYQNPKIKWVILEPNPDPVDGCSAHYEVGFFDQNYNIKTEFDTVIFSHLFEHIYRPDVFMASLASKMRMNNKLIFSVPDMQAMLKNMQTNTLNFEHTFYLAEPYVDYLVTKNGFQIIKKEYYQQHSIFYSCERKEDVDVIKLPNNLYDINKELIQKFIYNYQKFAEVVNDKMQGVSGRKVYLFGGHLFSQFLLAFGIHESKIEAILDNDAKKWGKRLQGCGLICESPHILAGQSCPIVIIRAGTYQDEIKKDILENINPSTEFWE